MGFHHRNEHRPAPARTVDWIARRARVSHDTARIISELAGFSGPDPDAREPLELIAARVIERARPGARLIREARHG